MQGKQIVIGAVLIIVVIIAAVITVKRTTGGYAQPPAWVLDQKVQKIDTGTLEVQTERLGDWNDKYAPDASGHFKNPKTGKYTMADVITCKACGKLIPNVQMAKGRDPGDSDKVQREYKCPYCGKNPFGF